MPRKEYMSLEEERAAMVEESMGIQEDYAENLRESMGDNELSVGKAAEAWKNMTYEQGLEFATAVIQSTPRDKAAQFLIAVMEQGRNDYLSDPANVGKPAPYLMGESEARSSPPAPSGSGTLPGRRRLSDAIVEEPTL